MEKNAAEYGIEGFTLDPPLEYDTVETTAPTSLTLVADILDLPAGGTGGAQSGLPARHGSGELLAARSQGQRQPLVAALQVIPAEHLDFLAHAPRRRRRDAGRHRQALRRDPRQHRLGEPPGIGPSRGRRSSPDSVRPARPGARGEEDDFGIGTPPRTGPRQRPPPPPPAPSARARWLWRTIPATSVGRLSTCGRLAIGQPSLLGLTNRLFLATLAPPRETCFLLACVLGNGRPPLHRCIEETGADLDVSGIREESLLTGTIRKLDHEHDD